jgi:hypothetical protein
MRRERARKRADSGCVGDVGGYERVVENPDQPGRWAVQHMMIHSGGTEAGLSLRYCQHYPTEQEALSAALQTNVDALDAVLHPSHFLRNRPWRRKKAHPFAASPTLARALGQQPIS